MKKNKNLRCILQRVV